MSGWYSYLEKTQLVPAKLIPTLAVSIIVFEILFPLLALIPRTRKLGSTLMAGLFGSFAAYHFAKIMSGDFTSCGCFGSALDLPPTPMMVITGSLAVGTVVAFGLHKSMFHRIGIFWRSAPKQDRYAALAFSVLTIGVLTFVCARQVVAVTTPKRVLYYLGVAKTDEFASTIPLQEGTRRKHLVVFVDYKCPYSRELLRDLPQLARWYGFSVSVGINPVLDPEGESLVLGGIAMSAARNGKFEATNNEIVQALNQQKDYHKLDASQIMADDLAMVSSQKTLGQRWGRTSVPLLLGVTEDGNVFMLSHGPNLGMSIERFASLRSNLRLAGEENEN
ncbi:MAG: hypothetical protein KF784_05025 [Fimbriimonadaceae bacterium]|nr:hypothetical protein [Fimbriimonadaceae bacterium]